MKQRLFLLSALAVGAVVFAQTNRGGITGTIADPTGGVIPGAIVTVTSIGTNQAHRLTTSDSGTYSVQDLDPVSYRIEVEAQGFKKAIVGEVKVDTATVATVNITVEPGSVDTQVSVTADAQVVNADSGTLSHTITERMVQDVPLVNRSVLDLAITAPNVSGDVGSENPAVTSGATVPGYNLSVGGGRPGSTTMLADGANNTGVGLARAVVSFSPETVQEFSVQTSAYSAEYGQTGGGVINVTTKSGNNDFHGQALWYTRNPVTNAAPFTTAAVNRPVSNLRQNQFSFTVGGPVWIPKLYNGHNKTFFFAAVEPRYQQDRLQADSLLPTDAMRRGDFSNVVKVANGWAPADVVAKFGIPVTGDATIYQQYNLVGNQLQPITLASGQTYQPYANNTIPQSMLDPIAQKALQYLPQASNYYINGSGQLVNWFTYRFAKQNETRYTARIDHIISDKNRLNLRLTSVPAIALKGFGSDINGNGADYSYSRQAVLSDTHTFSPTLYNDLRLNYTRGRFSGTYTPEFDIKTGRNLSTEWGLPSITTGGIPMFTFELNSFGNIGSQGSTLNDNVEERYNLADTLYWSKGAMTWKFGFDLSHALLNEIPFYAGSGGNYSFRFLQTDSNGTSTGTGGIGFASYLLGVPNAVTLRNVLLPYYYRWNSGAGFVQNDWKVRPNLTLNLGLRYSLQMPRTEKYNHQGTFLPELAKQYALPTPYTLTTGQVLTSATVVPFAYSGRGGRSGYLTPPNYLDFEPRFGFAWTPGFRGDRNLVIRGGYGLSHAPLTGNNRLPNPDFGASFPSIGATTGQANSNYVMRLSSNPPVLPSLTPDQYLNIPSDGLVYQNAINIPGFIVSGNTKTPYAQNWNLAISRQLGGKSMVEVAYTGAKGTHLFMPSSNINLATPDYALALSGAKINATGTVPDPLGRVDSTGRVLGVTYLSLGGPYLGYGSLNTFYNASANSIRHAAYVSFVRRAGRGLTLMSNYTFAKSIDDASDASPDKNVLTTGSVGGGQVNFGGTRQNDRSVSAFDVKHAWNTTFVYDLPFGKGRQYLGHMWKPLDYAIGGWTVTGVNRFMGGFPMAVTLVDGNYLGAATHTIRPDIVPGVPILNPLWDRNCPVGTTCQPYLNPAAFERPANGTLGNAPRTLDSVRGPLQRYFDASVQKNFQVTEKVRVQLRVDANNAFNHPVFRVSPNNGSGSLTDIFSAPSISTMSNAEYDAWAKFNNKPARTTPEGAALLAQAQAIVTRNQLTSGALPASFFSVKVPQGFALTDANSFDVTTESGYKLYRLRQAYNNGFGSLYALSNPRYIMFGLKIIF